MSTLTRQATFVMLLALPMCALGAELFRWTDENGNVHYTDRIPAQYVEQGYRVISEQGLTIKTITAKKDEPIPETIDQELEAQIERDKSLLTTYADESEIIMERDRRLRDIKSVVTLHQEAIYLLEKEFRGHTREASDYEKKGRPIPKSLQDKITTTEKKFTAYQKSIKENQQRLVDTQKHYADKLERYRNIVKILEIE